MSSALFRKGLGALRPVDDLADAIMADLKEGETVKVEVRTGRNLDRHRFYWKVLQEAVKATGGCFKNADQLHYALKLALGLLEEVPDIRGQITLRVKSTAFDRMSEAEFSIYFNQALDLLATEYGINPDDLLSEAA